MSLPPNFIAFALLAIGLIAAARLLWKRPQRWPWRLLLQSLALLLVYLVLNPPPQPLPQVGTLTVLGAGWQQAHRVGPGPPEPHARPGADSGDAPAVDSRDQDDAASTIHPPTGRREAEAAGTADVRSGAEATVGQGPPYAVSGVAAGALGDGTVAGVLNARAELGPPAAILALPDAETPLPPGVQRAPDLAAALRMRPEFSALRLFGRGLSLRDLQAARGRRLEFIAAPLPRGFVEIQPASQVTLGARIEVAARWSGAPPARVQVLDAAGEVLAEQVFYTKPAPGSASAAAFASDIQRPSGASTASPTAGDAAAPTAGDRVVPESSVRDFAPGSAEASAAIAALAAGAEGQEQARSQGALDVALAIPAGIVHLHTPARAGGALALRLRALDADE
ncbi:MAG: hypothetical protein ACOVKS_03600, partial [Aquimonas sp.]